VVVTAPRTDACSGSFHRTPHRRQHFRNAFTASKERNWAGCFGPYMCLVLKEVHPDALARIMRIGIIEKERHRDRSDRCSAAGRNDQRRKPSTSRLWFVDNLRVALICLVVLHHIVVTYSGLPLWYYIEKPTSPAVGLGLTIFLLVDQAWFMGAFFLLSGYFTPSSYERKGANLLRPALLIAFLAASRRAEHSPDSEAHTTGFDRWRGPRVRAAGLMTGSVAAGFGGGFAIDLPLVGTLVGTLVGAALAAFVVARPAGGISAGRTDSANPPSG
jgi:hypothetical protein